MKVNRFGMSQKIFACAMLRELTSKFETDRDWGDEAETLVEYEALFKRHESTLHMVKATFLDERTKALCDGWSVQDLIDRIEVQMESLRKVIREQAVPA